MKVTPFKLIFIICFLGVAYCTTGTMEFNDKRAAQEEREAKKAIKERAKHEGKWQSLAHPLTCSGIWTLSCKDFEPCKTYCVEDKK